MTVIEPNIDLTEKRIISVEEIKSFSSFNEIFTLDLKTKLDLEKLDLISLKYRIIPLVLKCDGIIFGHVLCYHDEENKIIYFEYFKTYGQTPKLSHILINHMIYYFEVLGCQIIVGPYNLLEKEHDYGFNLEEDKDYIDSFIRLGFVVFLKKHKNILLCKYY
ncbi:MAG: hypothetical protein ACTSPY_02460 [Candidatus Helarchaeota archaeon]